MREILFRGRRTDNHQWVYGYLVIDACENPNPYIIACRNHRVEHKSIGQFTGLLDKDGKRIFEGDVIRGFSYPFLSDGVHNYYAEVVWFENSPAFGLVTHKNPLSAVRGISAGNADYMEGFDESDWEIIGNIHDNPELLEATHEK